MRPHRLRALGALALFARPCVASALERPAGVQNPLPALLHESVLTTVGKTPIVRLRKLSPPGVDVYVKCEAFNPMGSVKDRLAMGIIEWAEARGQLKPGQTVVEASSGNTGIGLAMVCAAKGYPFVCVMSESFSIERRKLMRFLGAKVILTNPAHKGTGMLIKARELAEAHGYFLARQFESEANAWIHEQTTGPEILEAMGPRQLDYFVTGYGTGGTLAGVGAALRAGSPSTQIVACEPDNAPMLYSGVQTRYDGQGAFVAPHASWRPHLLQGWAPDFIPRIVQAAVGAGGVDKVMHVSGEAAMEACRHLAKAEGIFSGISGGGTLAAALELARGLPEGSSVLAMLPDTGERYLSTSLFDDVPADMTGEEMALSASTPSTPPPRIELPPVTDDALRFVRRTCGVAPIVVWSLQNCEFCWTAFKLLKALGVEYEVVNIDAFEYAEGDVGNQYRAALASLTECNTFPQIFIAGELFGGAADACIKWKSGELQPLLEAAGVKAADWNGYGGDPFEFLPKWMSQNPLRSK